MTFVAFLVLLALLVLNRTLLLGLGEERVVVDELRRPANKTLTTNVLTSAAGFNFFETIYLKNGTFFCLSPPGAPPYDPDQGGGGGFVDLRGVELPRRAELFSNGLPTASGDYVNREVSKHDIDVLAWEDRYHLGLDERPPLRTDGTTASPLWPTSL